MDRAPATCMVEILLIEDNAADVQLFRQAMKGPHHLSVAQTGAEALDRLFQRGKYEKEALPDIVVVDLNVPILSGHEVINVIKSNSSLQSIRVVVLSISTRAKDVSEAYRLGADAYIVKGLRLADMERTLSVFSDFWIGQVLYTRFADSNVASSGNG